MYTFTCAMPSASGPMRIPSTISTTTVGSTKRMCQRESTAPSVVARKTSTSDLPSARVSSAASRRCVPTARHIAGTVPGRPADSLAVRDPHQVEVDLVLPALLDRRVQTGQLGDDRRTMPGEHRLDQLVEHGAQAPHDLDRGDTVLANLGDAEREEVLPATNSNDERGRHALDRRRLEPRGPRSRSPGASRRGGR